MLGCALMLTFFVTTTPANAQEPAISTVVQTGHSDRVHAVAFSPNEKIVATGSQDETVRLWDVATGYELRTLRGHTSYVSAVAFSPDGKLVCAGGREGELKVWNAETGELVHDLVGHSWVMNQVSFSADGKRIVSGAADGRVIVWSVKTGEELTGIEGRGTSAAFFPDGKRVLVGGGKYQEFGQIWMGSVPSGEELAVFRGHESDIRTVDVSPDGKLAASGAMDGHVIIWSVKTGQQLQVLKNHKTYIEQVRFNKDGTKLISMDGKGNALMWAVKGGTVLRELPRLTEGFDWSKDERFVVTGGKDDAAVMLDLASGAIVRTFAGSTKSDPTITELAVHPGGYRLAARHGSFNKGTVRIWDLASGKLLDHPVSGYKGVTGIIYSPDGGRFLFGTSDHEVVVLDAESGKELFSEKDHRGAVTCVAFSADGRLMASGSLDSTVVVRDVETGKKVSTVTLDSGAVVQIQFISDDVLMIALNDPAPYTTFDRLVFRSVSGGEAPYPGIRHPWGFRSGVASSVGEITATGSGRYLNFVLDFTDNEKKSNPRVNAGRVELWETKTGQSIAKLEGHLDGIRSVIFSPDGKVLASGSDDVTIRIWDVEKGVPVATLHGHAGSVRVLRFSPDGRFLFSGSEDGLVKIWDTVSWKELASLISLSEEDSYAIIGSDRYYTATPAVAEHVHFVKGLQPYGFENFDLIFNRPDLVLDRLGFAGEGVKASYLKAYLKRLDKMGFGPDEISPEMHLPEVKIKNKDIPLETDQRMLTLNIKASDERYQLDRINVYINDVPIFGVRGLSVRSKGKRSVKKSIPVELSAGVNRVQVSVHNIRGAESLKKGFEISFKAPAQKPDLYVVAIGVSRYLQSAYDLKYAAKDAMDIAQLFENKKDLFDSVYTLTILDEEATFENILSARTFLERSGVDDQVVIFVAGHGLLSAELDYYFATHEVDFQHPEKNGLPYEALEELVDGIPARKKLILMDTCHSGELDKEEVEFVAAESNVKVRSFRGVGLVPRLGVNSVNLLLKTIFTDLRRGTGAVVITSSSGNEFSYEDSERQNGVFTFSVIEALKKGKARKYGGSVKVSQLVDYVSSRVRELTSGQQNPTMRREHLPDDFVIY